MKCTKIRIPACGLLLAVLLVFLAPAPARAEKVIPFHEKSYSNSHYWDDGLSDWMASRLTVGNVSGGSGYKQSDLYNGPISYCFDTLNLSEIGVKAGDTLTFSATVAFYPRFNDSAHIEIDFQPGFQRAESTIYSTLATGTAYAEVSLTVPEGAEEVNLRFSTVIGDLEHLYFRDPKLTAAEGTPGSNTSQNGSINQDPSTSVQTSRSGSSVNPSLSGSIVAYNGHTYQAFRQKVTWEEAAGYCESQSLDPHLLTINSADEQAFIEHYLKNQIEKDSVYNSRYMLGLLPEDGNSWYTGEPLAYTNWGEGEPDNFNGSQSVVVLTTEELSGRGYHVAPFQWDDEEDDGHYFIVEWDNISEEENDSTDLCKWMGDTHHWDPEKPGWESQGRKGFAESTIDGPGSASFCTPIYLDEYRTGQQLKFSGTFSYTPSDPSAEPVHLIIRFLDYDWKDVAEAREVLVTPTESSYYELLATIPDNIDFIYLAYDSQPASNLGQFLYRDVRLEYAGSSGTSQDKNAGRNLTPATGEWIPTENAYLNKQGWYILTEDKTWESGALWRSEPLQSDNFTLDFDFYTGSHDGADGIWFMFYADKNTVVRSNSGIIYTGGGYAVELDTYCNASHGDPASNHAAIIRENNMEHMCSADASGFTEDGAVHHMRVEVLDKVCTVYVDGAMLLRQGGIEPTGSYDMCFMGITGGISNLQGVINISLTAELLPDSGHTEQTVPGSTEQTGPGTTEPGTTGVTDSGNTERIDREDGSYTENGYYYFTDREGNHIYAPINSFAAYVVDYTPGDPWTSDTSWRDVQRTIGLPDATDGNDSTGDYNLGAGGVVVLGFGVGICDGPGNDVYVFEVGSSVEATKVEVSSDLETWYEIGVAEGRTAGLDISGKVPEGAVFQYVRLTDNYTDPRGTWPGADIDTVCGLNTRWIPEDQRQGGVSGIPAVGRTVWNSHSYQIFEGSMTWSQARDHCISLGGHLATVSTAEENDFLKSLAGNHTKKMFWLGGTDAAQEGTWSWTTGENWGFVDWISGEPDNKSGPDGTVQNCLLLDLERSGWDDLGDAGDSSGSWILKNIGFICEWE